MSTMDRNIVETAHCNSLTHKSEQHLRLGGLKLKDSIMKPKQQCEKGSLVKLPDKTTHAVRLNPNERELLSKLVVEAKANASAGDPQETSKPKSKKAVVADDPFSSLLRDLTKLLEPAEITKGEERLMRKMINNCIQRTLMELFAEIRDAKLTDVHEHATETRNKKQTATSRNSRGGCSRPERNDNENRFDERVVPKLQRESSNRWITRPTSSTSFEGFSSSRRAQSETTLQTDRHSTGIGVGTSRELRWTSSTSTP
jgi:hypothetical protein